MNDERADAIERFRHGLTPEDALRQPYYAELVASLAESDTAIDLLCAVRVEQRNPMVILAILHYLALGGHPILGPLFASLTSAQRPTPDEFANTTRSVLEAEPQKLRDQLQRTTQTNEVGRSAVLQAVLRELYRRGVHNVNLIDVGASAGLNLYLDHYPVSAQAVDDALTLVCESLTEADRPGELPRIHARLGVDLNPLDPLDPDDARWLRACLWPEDEVRLARLSAIERLLPSWPPVTLIRGGVMSTLDLALREIEPAYPTVVMHTWAAAYFPEPVQRSFAARMRQLVATSETYWVYAEWPRAVRGLTPPEPTTPTPREGACQLVVAEPGGRDAHWGWCHAHGRWLSLSPSTAGPKA